MTAISDGPLDKAPIPEHCAPNNWQPGTCRPFLVEMAQWSLIPAPYEAGAHSLPPLSGRP